MGMFDYVRSEVPLPDGFTGELQTKDFDCAMTTVLIRADGTLAIERFEQEVVPKSERPYPNDDGMLGLCGMLRRVNRRWEPIDHHGMVEFYGWEGDPNGNEAIWHEYSAKFTDGRLVGIEVVPA